MLLDEVVHAPLQPAPDLKGVEELPNLAFMTHLCFAHLTQVHHGLCDTTDKHRKDYHGSKNDETRKGPLHAIRGDNLHGCWCELSQCPMQTSCVTVKKAICFVLVGVEVFVSPRRSRTSECDSNPV